MSALRLAVCMLTVGALAAQTDDLHQRLFHALGPEESKRAEVLLQRKQWAEIEPMLAESSEGWALRGALEFLGGKMDGAVKCFERARSLGMLGEGDSFTLAMARVQLGQDEAARSELIKLSTMQPGKALYAYWLGRLDYDQRRYSEAVEKLTRATELDSKSARAWDSLGLAYDMQGKSEEALEAFETGAKMNREQAHPSAWPPHDLGALLLRMGDTKRAQAAFREALEYDPRMEPAHYHLGRVLEKAGENDEAVKEYAIAAQEDKNASDVCYSLAQLYRKMNRNQEADAMFAEWRKRRGTEQ